MGSGIVGSAKEHGMFTVGEPRDSEKSLTAGASPEYNFAICDKYCKYYNFWACGQIKQWELEEICDKCEIFPKNP